MACCGTKDEPNYDEAARDLHDAAYNGKVVSGVPATQPVSHATAPSRDWRAEQLAAQEEARKVAGDNAAKLVWRNGLDKPDQSNWEAFLKSQTQEKPKPQPKSWAAPVRTVYQAPPEPQVVRRAPLTGSKEAQERAQYARVEHAAMIRAPNTVAPRAAYNTTHSNSGTRFAVGSQEHVDMHNKTGPQFQPFTTSTEAPAAYNRQRRKSWAEPTPVAAAAAPTPAVREIGDPQPSSPRAPGYNNGKGAFL